MWFKTKTKDCRLIVKARASFGEKIDVERLERFRKARLRGFLKPAVMKNTVVQYQGPVGISLRERMDKPVSKRDFYFIMEQISVAVQGLQQNGLSVDPLLTDMDKVFINENTKEMRFIYCPLENDKAVANVSKLIEQVIYSTKLDGEEDREFLVRFTGFFRSLSKVESSSIEQFILGEDRSVVDMINRKNGKQNTFITDKPYNCCGTETDEEGTCLMDDEEEGTCLMDEEEGTCLMDEEEGTCLLDEEENFPYLIRMSNNARIDIDRQRFRLGKQQSSVDYCVDGNTAVSRSHADIITRGSVYYVKDLNSKNHTYINDVLVPVQDEKEIRDGDRLRLANEDFIFYL